MLPQVRGGKSSVVLVEVMTAISGPDALVVRCGGLVLTPLGSASVLVVFAEGVVLGAHMPVDVHGTHFAGPIRLRVGDVVYFDIALISFREVVSVLRIGFGDIGFL